MIGHRYAKAPMCIYQRENNSTQQQEGTKTTQLVSRNEQLNSSVGTKQLNSTGEKTTQLVSRNETIQLCTAVDRLQTTACNRLQPPQPPATTAYNRLQPPTTACTAFTAESAFSTYSRGLVERGNLMSSLSRALNVKILMGLSSELLQILIYYYGQDALAVLPSPGQNGK
ncbi:hypothetical protein TNCV_3574731 [Trichonephila clavipes]|nr:hypothetical protein TNCV_3574731 [Trichonephila clavipes]